MDEDQDRIYVGSKDHILSLNINNISQEPLSVSLSFAWGKSWHYRYLKEFKYIKNNKFPSSASNFSNESNLHNGVATLLVYLLRRTGPTLQLIIFYGFVGD